MPYHHIAYILSNNIQTPARPTLRVFILNNQKESAAFVMTSANWLDFLVFSDNDKQT